MKNKKDKKAIIKRFIKWISISNDYDLVKIGKMIDETCECGKVSQICKCEENILLEAMEDYFDEFAEEFIEKNKNQIDELMDDDWATDLHVVETYDAYGNLINKKEIKK